MKPWAAIMTALAIVAAPPRVVSAEEYGIGPWYVLAERDHAVAVLDDAVRTWTLMVRCTEGHVDFVVRRVDESAGSVSEIRRYQATLQVDRKPVGHLLAQTWSAGGYLVLDVGSLLPSLETGLRIDFSFTDGQSSTEASFLAIHTAAALKPVRDRCPAGVS
ncbi:hypothetical protein [Lichenifustis flavocetrariae]|uniref:Uncharacterized protein n=1 Tax=Lichenifustis flavocetrariae TaxID=2949735 RepID=A0AA41ZA12_9HYPH|nr:hypothetical protein [Lichenifustis flavocetrariae]MCW6512042.1 hypothetical protein [Lichenifustis flavocetrariae]